jgi:hypothetical protein
MFNQHHQHHHHSIPVGAKVWSALFKERLNQPQARGNIGTTHIMA